MEFKLIVESLKVILATHEANSPRVRLPPLIVPFVTARMPIEFALHPTLRNRFVGTVSVPWSIDKTPVIDAPSPTRTGRDSLVNEPFLAIRSSAVPGPDPKPMIFAGFPLVRLLRLTIAPPSMTRLPPPLIGIRPLESPFAYLLTSRTPPGPTVNVVLASCQYCPPPNKTLNVPLRNSPPA